MPSETRNLACSLDEATLGALGTPERASAIPLTQRDRTELAAQFGMDATLCFQHATGDMRAVGCFDAEGGPDTIPYQIIELTLHRP
jgi:hypothetical protein